MEFVYLFIISLFSNFLSALSGGGAGLLQLPSLILLGLPFTYALATHKLASIALGIGALLRYRSVPNHLRNIYFTVFISGVPGVLLGTYFVLSFTDSISTFLLGLITISLGIYSTLNVSLGVSPTNNKLTRTNYIAGSFVLFFIGFLNGSLTSGSGLFVTLWLVKFFKLEYKQAIACTLIIVGFFWNSVGAISLASRNLVIWSWIPILLFGSVLGGYLGSHFAIVKGSKLVKASFELISVICGLSMIFKSLV
tara:strand:+ start:49 stop:804 length:756 start_codon:yes stop_codon:yes gene_type:complete